MNESLIKQLKNYKILCIEDEEIIRNGIVNTLKYYFKEVKEASNGLEAYDIYKENKPDIILCDIEMPKLNGIKLIEKIRENDLDVIVIMITAYSSEEYLLELINLHINHYITKPISSDTLLTGIIKAFAGKLDEVLSFGNDLSFHMKTYQLFYKNEEIILRKRDIDFLLLLHKNKNQVLPYSLIEDSLWKDKSMSASALKTFIKEFRQRIPVVFIKNVQQIGYKLEDF